MTNYAFDETIPATNNNPSQDQPNMLINNASTMSIINEDHFTFRDNDGGIHKQMRIRNQAGIPGSLSALLGTLYTRAVSGITGSQLFYTPDTSGNQYQMTRTNAAGFGQFANNDGSGNGWSFLPGNILIQWGSVATPGAVGSVTYPIAFIGATFTVQLTPRNDGSHSAFTYYIDGAPSTTGFSYRASTAGSQRLYWLAIGL